MLLKNLIKDIPIKNKKINVKGLAINSKKIKKGYIFFAIKGLKSNGEKYIAEAVKKGASVIICSRKCKYKNEKIPIIKTSNIRNYLSQIASKFFKLKNTTSCCGQLLSLKIYIFIISWSYKSFFDYFRAKGPPFRNPFEKYA